MRTRAPAYAPGEHRHYFAQLAGYQVMPEEELFSVTPVALNRTVEELVSRPGVRTSCAACGEEIINQREVTVAGQRLCISCAHGGYYAAAISLPLRQLEYAYARSAAIHE